MGGSSVVSSNARPSNHFFDRIGRSLPTMKGSSRLLSPEKTNRTLRGPSFSAFATLAK